MSTTSTENPAAAAQEALWQRVTEEFREACLLRREGKGPEAEQILHQRLPQTISSWSQAHPGRADAKRAELTQLFTEERRRVDTALVVQQVVSQKLSEQLVPTLCEQLATQVRAMIEEQMGRLQNAMAEAALVGSLRPVTAAAGRVRFDDIPAVIDAVLHEQRTDFGARRTWSAPV